ncbi:metallophosphoesterase [Fontisphaera persica]|uniref:metallophosphoesterase family protein n=1 Tax=Fontisphaera persica TaxID=2974023 RepID=UPI0024BF6989|nr:metallophosphoesterase [Fontisphaera persica]WCJ58296.1 metallophosphoesterase [Fontisphaera persica]
MKLRHFLLLGVAAWLALPWLGCRTPRNTSSAASPEARYPVRIAFLSDIHITHRLKQDQPVREQRLREAIAAVNAEKVDLVLLGGDLTEDGTVAEFRDFQRLARDFSAPVWYVPGNHDIGNKRIEGKKESVTSARNQRYESVLGPSWWVREHAGVRVVGVNGPLLGSGLPEESKMWAEVERALARTSAVPTLVLVHFPPFQSSNSEPGGVYWNLEPQPRARLLGLARQAGVKTILSGHLHRNLTNTHEGITLLTTTTIGVGDPRKNPPRGWMLLTVEKDGRLGIHPRTVRDKPSPPKE